MEAQQAGALIFRAPAIFAQPVPDLACRAIFRNLFEEIIVCIEEEGKPRPEFIDIESAPQRPFHVLDTVINGECQLLQRGRARLANVVAGNGNRVPARRELRAKLKGIDDQPHAGRRGKNVFLLRDVFLQDVVLDGAA